MSLPGKLKNAWTTLRNHYWLSLGADLALILLVFWGIHAWNTRDLPGAGLPPDLRLPQLGTSGEPQSLPEQGPGVVYFFAPWCTYCRHSIGNVDALVRDGDLAWARAVALDYQNLEELGQFVNETALEQPVLLGDASVARAWHVRAFPTYFVIGPDGHIESRSVGYATRLGLELRARLAR
jgi:thiol-disulfide isomerase/thioredoxin